MPTKYRIILSEEFKVGDTEIKDGLKYTISSIDKENGKISWDIEDIPDYEPVYYGFEELKNNFKKLSSNKNIPNEVKEINQKLKNLFSQYKKYLKNNQHSIYKKIIKK